MSFSDDDLKRLKVLKLRYKDMECIPYGHADITALLARLGAAENCMQHNNCECAYCDETTIAWRKSCGK